MNFQSHDCGHFCISLQVEDSYLIRYLPTKSTEEEGLESATLGLSYEVTDFHFAPTVHPGKIDRFTEIFV